MSTEKKVNSSVNDKYLSDLKALVLKYGIEPDTIDWVSLDWSLSYQELKTIVLSTVEQISGKYIEEKYGKIDEEFIKMQEETYFKGKILRKENLEKVRTIAVYGDIGTGKTALVYKILETLKDKHVYVLKHPKPWLLEQLGYKGLNSLEQIEKLQDCVIYWDEPQLSTTIYDHKTNGIIAKVCSLARQLGITLIISSSDTRVFTKHNESYFDLWLIKDLDYEMVKNGSKIKKAVRNNTRFDTSGFKLDINEFISESRTLSELNGKHSFELPNNWSEALSKPYRN